MTKIGFVSSEKPDALKSLKVKSGDETFARYDEVQRNMFRAWPLSS